MKIVLFGSSDFSIPTLQTLDKSSHDLISVVTPIDKPRGRGKKVIISNFRKEINALSYPNLQFKNFNLDETVKTLQKINADLFVVVAFQKLPDKIINIPKYGCVNIHPSKLPKYRGSSPIQYAILNGDKEIGISIIKISSKIDSGNILYQTNLAISDNENFGDIYYKSSVIGADNLIKTINLLNKNIAYRGIIQDDSNATYAKKLFAKDFKINWNKTSLEIYNQIRAFSPYPGAYSFLNKKRFKIFKSKIILEKNMNLNLPAGSIKIEDNSIYVKTKDNFLSLLILQIEGKKKMDVASYLKGNNLNCFNFDE